ncbi:MAG: hypothetical protein MSC53_04605 [Arcanobacterium sp.]|nr:hypothetical protein [Arcanobacterium sp.]MDY5273712.1 YiiX/YebB-like N1pC/P60 family cysteine hydrolase [Arcanobacterium sp.]
MNIFKFSASSVAGLALALSFPSIASAEPYTPTGDDSNLRSLVTELVEQSPGASYEEMMQAVEDVAISTGTSETQVASEALAELNSQANNARIQPRSGSKPSANKAIGTSRYRGDVFYTPASTAGVNHGHSGIYSYTTKIIEANPGSGVAERSHTQVKVASGARKQYVSTSQANRNKAANRARTYLGRGYNYIFALNKTERGSMNCSQTVWAAYKNATGIDLDSNGGPGVYPSDILNSRYTKTYQTY